MGDLLTDEELCLVSLVATNGVGPASISAIRKASRRQSEPLQRLLSMPAAELAQVAGLGAPVARAAAGVESPRERGRQILRQCARLGAQAVFAGRPEYPARVVSALGRHAPPVLFVQGAVELLQRPCVGVVGSRRPSPCAREAARRFARELAGGGTVIVSGGARGIDTEGHRGALLAGSTIFVPPKGLGRFHWRGGSRAGMPAGRWCMVGQFHPQAGWRTPQALLRNRTICALSEAVVAFDPRDTGGTWHSANSALAMRKPVFVVSGSRNGARGRGLERLVRRGATALDPARMPDSDAFRRMLADYCPPPQPAQECLFGGQEHWSDAV